MKVLCCLDGTNLNQLSNALKTMIRAGSPASADAPDPLTIGLLYVTDTGPHGELERQRERFMRPPHMLPGRQEQMRQAETTSAQDILDEGVAALPGAERMTRTGRPEREIVNCAAEWNADLILICPRSTYGDKPETGPKSVGHVARFVLDHAPCPVLLVRPLVRKDFPLPR